MSHSWTYTEEYDEIRLTAKDVAAPGEPSVPVIETDLDEEEYQEACENSTLLDACAAEILRMDQRIKDLEAVISERGTGIPRPSDIDRDAFEALVPEDRFLAFLEAAGWALEARGWEKKAEDLEAQVEAALRGQAEISETSGRALDQWRAEKTALEAEPARIRREILALLPGISTVIVTEKGESWPIIATDTIRAALDRVIPGAES